MHLQAVGPIGLLKEELRTGFQALWLTLKFSWGRRAATPLLPPEPRSNQDP
jgi:hypothetical protein